METNYQSLIRSLMERGVNISDVVINQVNLKEVQIKMRFKVGGDRKWRSLSFYAYRKWLGTRMENIIVGKILSAIFR